MNSCRARVTFGVLLLTIVFTLTGAKGVAVKAVCRNGQPLDGPTCDGDGMGPNSQTCPRTHYCLVDPLNSLPICCPKPSVDEVEANCPHGDPLDMPSCGRVLNRQDCPKSHYCLIDPVDRFAICCRKPRCRVRNCRKECPKHKIRRINKDGCQTCNCWNPCRRHRSKCKLGEKCILKQVECFTTPCPPIPQCVPCPQLSCQHKCPEGKTRKIDRDGCETCRCWNPCRGKKCVHGQICVLDHVVCVRAPCPPLPICVPCPPAKCPNPCASDQLYKLDRHGCTTCKCYKPCRYMKCGKGKNCAIVPLQCLIAPCPEHARCMPCPTPMCTKCTYGEKKGLRFKNGCQLCPVCKDPCQHNRHRRHCPDGRRCLINQAVCKKAPCHHALTCTDCPLFKCKGCTATQTRIKDKDGCDTCGCRNVCDDKRCLITHQCVEQMKCGHGDCHLIAKCVPRCKGGQVWKNCGSACTKTCSDPSPACTEQCVMRCECPDTAPIWSNGQCIGLSDCKVACEGGQEWRDCGSGCTSTCLVQHQMCTLQCVPRCQCPIENNIWWNEQCIPSSECP